MQVTPVKGTNDYPPVPKWKIRIIYSRRFLKSILPMDLNILLHL